MKFSKKYIAVFLVIIIACSIAYFVSADDVTKEDGSIHIHADGEELTQVSYTDIMQLKSYRRQVTVHSTAGDFVGDFRGAMLSDVLELAIPSWSDYYTEIKIVGADGYYTELKLEEVLAENNAFLMYSDSDESIMSQDGKIQSGRLVVIGDSFGQRFTNYVNEIYLG